MSCFPSQPRYANPPFRGIAFAQGQSDGYQMHLRWFPAFSPSYAYNVGYNIYYSSIQEDVFTEGPKYVITDGTVAAATVTSLVLGDVYFFAVRAFLYEISFNQLTSLPLAQNGLNIYPEAVLLTNVSQTDLSVQISDPDTFPPFGIIQLGTELMYYTNVDFVNSSLIIGQRGYLGSNIRFHLTDGYDGYYYQNPLVLYFKGLEDDNTSTIMEENKFFETNYPYVDSDGYRERTEDLLHSDFSGDDAENEDFPNPDFSGYHGTSPEDLLKGYCVGSYLLGEQGCADGYLGVGMQIRGPGLIDANTQRENELLQVTGEPIILLRRLVKGKYCYCFDSTRESPTPHCPVCFGVGFVSGYEQFRNDPRRSDGRILVHFDPTVESLPALEPGQESTFNPNSWTINYPTIKDRDVIVRFNTDGVGEEYRYEVTNVTRNKLALNSFGAQKLTLTRIRKTDPIYQVPVFANSATIPTTINTSIGFMKGPGGALIPHTHTLKISETITSLSQINQQTEVSQGHNHTIINGNVLAALDHTHNIII